MDPKTHVVKSKSGNSAITNKSDRSNKKTRSDAEFQPNLLKKRGVYVKNKPTDLSINTQNNEVKAPPRPRPGRKKFLASVLTILSKSTAGTQYPDPDSRPGNKRPKLDSKKATVSNVKAKKFRSKVLNVEANKNLDQNKILVIKSKNDTLNTSNSEIDVSNKFNIIKSHLINIKNSDIEIGQSASVEDVAKIDKKVRIDEPPTLVENTETNKGNKGEIFDFFVDLLETTFKSCKNEPNSGASSVDNLQIDDNVAKRLKIKPEIEFEAYEPPFKDQFKIDDEYVETILKQPIIKPKLKTQSFIYPRRKSVTQQKRAPRKLMKKDLINEFKEELHLDLKYFEEPKNLYQALKVIAQNKRKRKPIIDYTRRIEPKCSMRRRKILSLHSNLKKLNSNEDRKPSFMKPTPCARYIAKINSKLKYSDRGIRINEVKEPSCQSIEVVGYDYETSTSKRNLYLDDTYSNYNNRESRHVNAFFTDSDYKNLMYSVSHTYQ